MGFSSNKLICFLLLLEMVDVIGQSGFVNIDCGIPPDQAPYLDPATNLMYVSDIGFIDTGVNMNVGAAYADGLRGGLLNLRSFPEGARNCYTINVTAGSKYLVRATFKYGNYDNVSTQPYLFELHLGVNLWQTMNITDPNFGYRAEVITVATGDVVSVCLVNTGTGTPFISVLEVRPLKTVMYPAVNASRSLVVQLRSNMGTSNKTYRYPVDPYDRIWYPLKPGNGLTEISTPETVNNYLKSYFEVPSIVMQSAWIPVNTTSMWWSYPAGDINECFIIAHFAEIVNLTDKMSRQFYVKFNDQPLLDKTYSPSYLFAESIYDLNPISRYIRKTLLLEALPNSTLPPILNAMEVYSTMRNDTVPSDSGDVGAMMAIRSLYQIGRNWNGDPCSPKAFAWKGLNCTYSISSPPRVTTLNLTSNRLTGQISGSFGNLGAIQYLDLSYNNLTGEIPDSLAGLSSLKVLDLRGNQLSGSIPSSLLAKAQNGFITLRIDGNPNLCDNGSSCNVTAKKKISTPVIIIICIVAAGLLLVLLFILYRVFKKSQGNGNSVKPQNEGDPNAVRGPQDDTLQLDQNRQFTYLELKRITNNFEKELGVGGFGKVFFGLLEDGTEVAVKMRSNSSSQGNKEFLAEAQTLTRVHHRNLVTMIGYCKDEGHLGLVYEFMALGTLSSQLKGRTRNARVLDWRQRLQIAAESAQGLEYLHKGCKPPLVHRDVKTSNILLSDKLEAKIADFGLSRAFQNDANNHVSTAVMGTPGYLDPEYYICNQLSEKSDVYSFGIVLLELITGQNAIRPDNTNLAQWVSRTLARGNIEDVIDAKMQGRYDINSVWKCAELALKCTSHSSQQRPTMSDVVMQLKESLELETANHTYQNSYTSSENLYSEVSDVSRNSAVESEHVARMSVVAGPSAR